MEAQMAQDIYDFKFNKADKSETSLADYKGKVLLVVNTASKCGFTNQYDGLEKLHEDLNTDGLEVLGFPCNQFGKQEDGTDSEIQEFCSLRFNIKFPVFQKVEVNGKNALPLFNYLKTEAPGLLGSKAVKRNFTKFLVDREGNVIKRFAPKTEPESIRSEIEALLKK